MFSKKATKIDEIFTVDLTLCSQIDGEDFFNFVAFSENMNYNSTKNHCKVGNIYSISEK
jgi:hypothetical protein